DPNRRGSPNRCGRGEPPNIQAFFHDDASTKKADAGDDPLHHPGRIWVDGQSGVSSKPETGVTNKHGEPCRSHAYQAESAHPGSTPVVCTLVTNQQPQN